MAARRFHLLDALLLIAATAIGIALSRPLASQTDFSGNSWITPATKYLLRAWWCLQISLPLPATLTLTILALALRPPRTTFQRRMRQPGAVAGVTWATVAGLKAIGFLVSALRSSRAAPLMILSDGWDTDTF